MPAKKTSGNVVVRPKAAAKKAAPVEDPEEYDTEGNGAEDDQPVAPRRRRTTAPTAVMFEAPPVSKRGRGKSRDWDDFIAALNKNPGNWAVVGVYNSPTNRPSALKEAGAEFTVRSVQEENEDGESVTRYKMWARIPVEGEEDEDEED